ncbi:MAG: hypothetical protein IPO56_17205 [Flavobacteriales bacterium]|nr:hypothetical protein [Flavobacteriales bacterium]
MNDRTDTETSSGSASETTVAGGTLTADNDEAATERARAEAIELANRTEATLSPKERLPVKRYEDFLRGENVILKQEALDRSRTLICVTAGTCRADPCIAGSPFVGNGRSCRCGGG